MSTLRSVVRRNCSTTPTTKARAFTGMELYIRTAITDRVHDGIYNTDKGHKATIASRVKGGKIHSPSFSRHRKRPVGDHGEGITSHEVPDCSSTCSGVIGKETGVMRRGPDLRQIPTLEHLNFAKMQESARCYRVEISQKFELASLRNKIPFERR